MITKKRMLLLGEYEGIEFYQYSPTLLRPYFMNYPKQDHPPYARRAVHKVRMMLEYLRGGYLVYYLVRDHMVLGHVVVARGGRRLKVSTQEDIVIGPIFVSPALRGNGIGTTAIRTVLKDLGLQYRYAYEFIKEDNTASIRAVEKTDMCWLVTLKKPGL